VSLEIDPLDVIGSHAYGSKGVPHDTWTRLRSESPVHWCDVPGYENFWAITKHADIMDISGRPEVFSNRPGIVVMTDEQRRSRENADSPLAKMRTIIEMDPPEHVDFRKVASGFFTPRSISRLDEIVADSARNLLDSLGSEGECDFVDVVAARHPLRVLSTILGINREDEDRLMELTQQLFAGDDPDLQRQGEDREKANQEMGLEFYQLFDGVIQDRQANPRDDLATLLANAKLADGNAMGPIETFGYYLIVFTAGHDTTRNALSGGLKAFVDNPEQLARVRENPKLVKSAVEEVVRWASPVNYMKRRATRDVEIRGQKIREGEFLSLFYASANRDEEVFDDPFRFDVSRRPNRHLGFGTGEHFCLGAHVARASMRALVEQLAERVELLELVGEPAQISSSFVVGLKKLPVRYRLRPSASAA
jgi:cytochrome P450